MFITLTEFNVKSHMLISPYKNKITKNTHSSIKNVIFKFPVVSRRMTRTEKRDNPMFLYVSYLNVIYYSKL